jgi:MYXO-CTERM domain-containing protein
MTGKPQNGFVLLDYAYADPGEPIKAGQTSSAEQAPNQDSTDEQAPGQGSLGWLALGAVGLLALRKTRSLTARLEDPT